ncbi:MAG: hypothetical protein KDD38_06785, partial [Bdellovibrionales bacterium]|nr:hypothetical protein [Bdellovibrionales bacterium]
MKKILKFFLISLSALVSISAQAEDSRIENAIGLRVTAKGQKIFKDNLQKLLFLNGVPVDSFYVESMEFSQAEPLELSPAIQEYLDIINLGTTGVDIAPSQLHTQIKNFEASLRFNELSLRFFPTQYNTVEGGGAASVLALLRAKVSLLRADVSSVLADDLANPFLGQFGFNNFSLRSKVSSPDLEIEVPLFITVEKGREDVGLSVGIIKSSLSSFDLEYDFEAPAVLPEIEVVINGTRIGLDKVAVSNELLSKQDRLLRVVKGELDSYIQTELPVKINEMLQENVFGKFSEVNLLTPIGSNIEHNGTIYNPTQPDDLFQWKIRLDEFKMSQDDMVAALSASVRDPKSKTVFNMATEAISSNSPASDQLKYPTDQYDVAISLNQGFLNRFLELSFNRGYFENIPGGEPGKKVEFLHISKSPLVRFDLSPEAGDIVRVQIEVRPEVSGIQKLAVNSKFRVSVTANVKLVPTDKGYGLMVDSLDEDFSYDKKGLRLGIFKSQVDKAIIEQIREVNAERPKTMISDDIPIPTSLMGLSAKPKHISPSRAGY